MATMMRAPAPPVTARTAPRGHDPMIRDVIDALAAAAHGDTEPDDSAAVARGAAPSRRTANRWRQAGRGSPAEAFGSFLLDCRDPFRMLAHVKALAKRAALAKLTNAELIERYRDLRIAEKQREAADTILDMDAAAGWLDRAAASERDAALDEECAAIERVFAERRITPAEVFGGSR